MHSKLWDEITAPFNGTAVEAREWINNFIPHFIMDVITYLLWDLSSTKLENGTQVA